LAKGIGACRFTTKPRQQPLTEASTGVDHTSASPDDAINLVRMAPAQLVVFIEKQAGECMTPSLSEERIWSQKGLHLVCSRVVKGQSI